ncbi:IS110 family RNA-guided transposase [Spirosoma endbachense]|uniref:IS110 family transposase n=1 Tax=Spirosoma endbachense TaxID=2666025 RepID=A0A6P1VTX3_9BACT|nr:IS110 family transposase [Spirosoma endbachense]QHV96671.1 IS110 family transposase [Spirosoma endbachense]
MGNSQTSFTIIHSHAAGIDVGSRSHLVAVDQNKDHVREFGVYTKDHQQLINHLHQHGITTIAMESTGSYWQTLFTALQQAGFEVLLVSGSQTKNVKGRKTDVIDCIWIQKLHSLGLLSGSLLLSDTFQQLRTYYYHRQHLVQQSARYSNKMQKTLRLMNIRLDVVLNDITGQSGMAVIEAILEGHREADYLVALVSARVKNRAAGRSRQEIGDALQGWWREELLFELRACLDFNQLYESKVKECDKVIEAFLVKYAPPVEVSVEEKKQLKTHRKRAGKHAPDFNLSQLAYQYFRTDLFAVSGISYNTVFCLLTSLGHDIHKFPNAKSFASWLGLVPNNKVSGGKVISNRRPSGRSSIAKSLRQAANSIGNQKDHELTPFFRRIAFKKGRIAAIIATARKLAVIIWHMLTKGEAYHKERVEQNQEKQRAMKLKHLDKKLHALQLSKEELERLLIKHSLSIG